MKELKNPGKSVFEQIRRVDENGVDYWSAREMAKILEYSEYRHFLPVIEKAKEACANSNNNPLDHFEDILEMVSLGSGAERSLKSVKLSRYACYLIVQNADPSKEVVANGQTYFAIQTRIAEIRQMDEYIIRKTKSCIEGKRNVACLKTKRILKISTPYDITTPLCSLDHIEDILEMHSTTPNALSTPIIMPLCCNYNGIGALLQ